MLYLATLRISLSAVTAATLLLSPNVRAQKVEERAAAQRRHARVEKTIRHLERRANGGDARAQYALGRLYEEGSGVRKNFGYAISWYEEAARNGSRAAALKIRSHY